MVADADANWPSVDLYLLTQRHWKGRGFSRYLYGKRLASNQLPRLLTYPLDSVVAFHC